MSCYFFWKKNLKLQQNWNFTIIFYNYFRFYIPKARNSVTAFLSHLITWSRGIFCQDLDYLVFGNFGQNHNATEEEVEAQKKWGHISTQHGQLHPWQTSFNFEAFNCTVVPIFGGPSLRCCSLWTVKQLIYLNMFLLIEKRATEPTMGLFMFQLSVQPFIGGIMEVSSELNSRKVWNLSRQYYGLSWNQLQYILYW